MVNEFTNSVDELSHISDSLETLITLSNQTDIKKPLEDLAQAVDQVSKAWSGSWLGYHANVYYKDFQPPPPGAHFSAEWGISDRLFARYTVGEWSEYNVESVIAMIYELAGNPDLKPAQAFNEESIRQFRTQRMNILSIIEVEAGNSESTLLKQLKEDVDKLSVWTENTVIETVRPKGTKISRDSTAIGQGLWVPPHYQVLSQVISILHTTEIVKELAETTRQVASHITRQRERSRQQSRGTKVFIGHGKSPLWRELKDFIESRLHLSTDEFNRVPVAGVSTKERLSEMLDEASIAFLIMTGEDEQPDGKSRARENVVHEVGLFQGRIGFQRAIVLLEEGCEEFSNITGLGQIRFPKGNIAAKFEDIRRIVEREISS